MYSKLIRKKGEKQERIDLHKYLGSHFNKEGKKKVITFGLWQPHSNWITNFSLKSGAKNTKACWVLAGPKALVRPSDCINRTTGWILIRLFVPSCYLSDNWSNVPGSDFRDKFWVHNWVWFFGFRVSEKMERKKLEEGKWKERKRGRLRLSISSCLPLTLALWQ